jgi:hypothetical protein
MNRWDISKQRSNYHFDPFAEEDYGKYIKKITNIYQDWSTELEYVSQHEVDEYWAPLDQLEKHSDINRMLEDWNIPKDSINFKIYEVDDKTPILNTLAYQLGLEDAQILIQSQYTGQMAHLHIDSDSIYKGKNYKYTDDESQNKQYRVFVMLEDWKLGHIINIGNTYLKPWRAGDVIWFDFYNIPHSTANTGPWPRKMAKVTGKTSRKFLNLMENSND